MDLFPVTRVLSRHSLPPPRQPPPLTTRHPHLHPACPSCLPEPAWGPSRAPGAPVPLTHPGRWAKAEPTCKPLRSHPTSTGYTFKGTEEGELGATPMVHPAGCASPSRKMPAFLRAAVTSPAKCGGGESYGAGPWVVLLHLPEALLPRWLSVQCQDTGDVQSPELRAPRLSPDARHQQALGSCRAPVWFRAHWMMEQARGRPSLRACPWSTALHRHRADAGLRLNLL